MIGINWKFLLTISTATGCCCCADALVIVFVRSVSFLNQQVKWIVSKAKPPNWSFGWNKSMFAVFGAMMFGAISTLWCSFVGHLFHYFAVSMVQCIWKCSYVINDCGPKTDRDREWMNQKTNKHSNGNAITNPYATFRRAFKVIYVFLLIRFFSRIRSVWSVYWASVYGIHMCSNGLLRLKMAFFRTRNTSNIL